MCPHFILSNMLKCRLNVRESISQGIIHNPHVNQQTSTKEKMGMRAVFFLQFDWEFGTRNKTTEELWVLTAFCWTAVIPSVTLLITVATVVKHTCTLYLPVYRSSYLCEHSPPQTGMFKYRNQHSGSYKLRWNCIRSSFISSFIKYSSLWLPYAGNVQTSWESTQIVIKSSVASPQ